MENVICTICPKGCRLQVDINENIVTGNTCKRGFLYGLNEVKNPERVITSTVTIINGTLKRLPVKTEKAISKFLNFKAIEEIKKITVTAPVKCGDVLINNFLDTGVNLVATFSIKENKEL